MVREIIAKQKINLFPIFVLWEITPTTVKNGLDQKENCFPVFGIFSSLFSDHSPAKKNEKLLFPSSLSQR